SDAQGLLSTLTPEGKAIAVSDPRTSSAPSRAAVLDGAATLARLGGNAALLEELAGLFVEDCPLRLTEMDECLGRQDARGLYFAVHQFRGSLSCFGAPSAGERAWVLEASA